MRLFSDPHVIFQPNPLRISESAKGQILDSLYSGIGLTRVRVSIEARGIEPVNDNADPAVTDLSKFNFAGRNSDDFVPAVADIRRRTPLMWWASPGGIETWMNAGNPEEHVEWAMALHRRWRSQGMEFPFYSIINEPSYVASGGPWSGEYLRDVVKLLGRKLRAEGFATKIVIADDLSASQALDVARVILADPEARGYVGAVAFHIYGLGLAGAEDLKALAKQHGIQLWMSEYSMETAFQWVEMVHSLLTTYDVSAVDYMWGFFGEEDGSHLISVLHSGGDYLGFKLQPQFHVFGNYTKYVRPGAVRVRVSPASEDIKVSAFTQNGRLTIVAINSGYTSSTTVRFDVAGLASNRDFAAVRTRPENGGTERLSPLAPLEVRSNSITATLPARSVSTFYQ